MNIAQEFTPKQADPLAIINSLLIAAMEVPNRLALEFIITNDTRKLLNYDRAILCQIDKSNIFIISISGQSSIYSLTDFHKKLTDLLKCLKDPGSTQMLSADKFSDKQELWAEHQKHHSCSVLWLPIYSKGELSLGLWVERWEVSADEKPSEQTLSLLSQYLLPGYGAAWERFKLKFKLKLKPSQKYKIALPAVVIVIGLLSLIHLPLRIVASCEVIPKDPTIITSPLHGVIEKILVAPGDHVNKGASLVEYDKRVFAQELKIALEEYAIAEAALNRALSLGVNDPSSLSEVAVLQLKLKKQKIDVEVAQENYNKIVIKSPDKGTVIIDDVDQWVGKPVQIGEKIMTIADLTKTKVKIWIPENDNINMNPDLPIQVILNVDPSTSRTAKIEYVVNEVSISDQQVPSFIAEAHWENASTDVKPGLKGTAIVYGEKVSLFYYLFRKPWIIFRKVLGI